MENEFPPEKEISDKQIIVERFNESSRKTKAFYVTLATVVLLFFLGHWFKEDSNNVISAVVQLGSVYIGGLAVTDSMRYYKFGSKTLGNPEKRRPDDQELTIRYKDR